MRLIASLWLFMAVFAAQGQATFQSRASGNWTDPAPAGTWTIIAGTDGDGVPDADDQVEIVSTHVVSVNVNSACANLTLSGTGILSINNPRTLAAGGNFTMNGNTTVQGGANSVLTVGGNFSVPAGQSASWQDVSVTINGTTNIQGYFAFTVSDVGDKTFNGTITVVGGGTWDNVIGEDPILNCSVINNGNWPSPSGPGNAVYTVSASNVSYTYSGNNPIEMTELNLNSGTNVTVTNLGILVLSRNGVTNALNIGAGRTFNNGDGVAAARLVFSADANVPVTGAGTINFAPVNNTVDYNFAGDQDIHNTTYYNLSASTSGVKALLGTTTVTNTVAISGSAVVNTGTSILNGTGSLVMTGTSDIRFARTGVSLPELTGTLNSFAPTTSITLNATAATQTLKTSATYPYQNVNLSGTGGSVDFSLVTNIARNLTFSNAGRMTNNAVLTVGESFIYNSSAITTLANNITVGSLIKTLGVVAYSNRTITINGTSGSWSNSGGTFTSNASSNVIFTTGTGQTIGGSITTTFSNLTINNSNSVSLSGVDITVSNNLNFILGRLITGSRFVRVASPGTVTASASTGWVQGNLRKDVALGSPSITYEVGGAVNYAPVDVALNTVTVTGTITVSSTDGVHPNVAGANIEPNKSANRFWTITNIGVTFTDYSATFNFQASDRDALFDPLTAVIMRTNGVNWFSTSIGTRTAVSSQFVTEASGNLPTTQAQSFAIGNLIVTTGFFNSQTGALNWSSQATWIQNRPGSIQFTVGSPLVTGTGTDFVNELADGDVIMLQTDLAPARRYTVLAGSRTATTLTLTSNAVATTSGGYGRERVPNSLSDVVTIGNANILPDATTTITLDQNATVNTINLNTAASPLTTTQNLTHSGTNALTVQVDAVINQPGAAGTNAWNINAGSATVNNNVTLGTGNNDNARIGRVNITTGSLTVNNFTFTTFNAGGAQTQAILDMSGGAGRLNLRGAFIFTNNRGTLTPGTTSTVNFNGTLAQTLNRSNPSSSAAAFVFNHLLFNNTSAGGVTLTGTDFSATNVTGNFRVQTGSVFTTANFDITGGAGDTFQIDPGATFQMNGSNATFPTGYTTFNLGTTAPFGTVVYNEPGATNITSQTYGNLSITGANTFTLPGDMTISGNLTIGSGGSTTLQGANGSPFTLNVGRNLTIANGATLEANRGANNGIGILNVGGNWINNGSFSGGTGTQAVIFTGTGPTQPQVIAGTATTTFNNLTINTGAATNVVRSDTGPSVSNILTLTLGSIDLNGTTLNVTNTFPTAIVRTSGYLRSEKTSAPYGELRWTTSNQIGTFEYPFGKSSTEYIPVRINKTVGGSVGGTISVWTYASAADNSPLPSSVSNLNGTVGGNSVTDRFWGITLSGYATRPTASLTFTAVGTNAFPPSEKPASIADIAAVAASPAGIAAQVWNPAGYWDPATASQTFGNNLPAAGFFQVTAPSISLQNTYLPWVLVDISAPLPVELTNFKGRWSDNEVQLEWATASELNNDFFTIERSQSGEVFEEIERVKGAGTTQLAKTYRAADSNAPAGLAYYRLRQTDFDGTFTFSNVIRVDVPVGASWVMAPNPNSGEPVVIRFSQQTEAPGWVRLIDVNGRLIYQGYFESGYSQWEIAMAEKLPSGLYLMSVSTSGSTTTRKLVVR
ncbi:MAG: T9SS type A sorting domain-containing protein [Cyclobacteriaceae bacterium]|jgi:hypothetical protein